MENLKREKALDSVRMYVTNDWELVEETPEYFLLKRNEQSIGVHLLIFMFTVWFTLGLANVGYWYISRKTKKVLK